MRPAAFFNDRITIERKVKTVNAINEPVHAWEEAGSFAANCRPIRGREYFQASQVQSEVEIVFTIRKPQLAIDNETMRIVWRGQPHEIVSPAIDVGGLGEELELMCKQGVGDGR